MSSTKAKVLFVIENELYGGGERAFAQLINGLDKSRFDIFAACLADDSNPASRAYAHEIERSARIINLDLRRLINPAASFKLKSIIHDYDINIVHCQGARADFYASLAVRLSGKAALLVSTVAAPVSEYDVHPLRKTAYKLLDRFSAFSIDKFIAVAGHIESKLTHGRGIPAENVVKIYNGIELERYVSDPNKAAKTREDWGVAPGCFLVGAFSRLSREKGLVHLIEAAKLLAGNGEARIRYLIAGNGGLEESLRLKVKELGLEKTFILTGFLNDVKPALSAVDLIALPSLREGFPMAVLEAMAMGKPVVASNIDGVNESVENGVTGTLVPPGNSAVLAEAISVLAHDRKKGREMGGRGRAAAREKFGLDKMIRAHELVYEELLRRSGRDVPRLRARRQA